MGSIPFPPSVRWGIIGAGQISSWFVGDLTLPRQSTPVTHIIAAIGSSSISKGEAFAARHINPSCTHPQPAIYDDYASVYADPAVDIVYIGTPHAFHMRNCLDAIAAGKHVLCEKPFTMNAREAMIVLAAAMQKGVFIMEAVWTRFHPLMAALKQALFVDKVIGDVRRTFCDFGLDMNFASLPAVSRLKKRELGAGSMLDIGIYSLTWGLSTLESGQEEEPTVKAVQSLVDGVDVATSMLVFYEKTGRTGVLTSSLEAKTEEDFCRIEGTEGYILVKGLAASSPQSFTVYPKVKITEKMTVNNERESGIEHNFEIEGRGFHFEADAVALDILEGRKENVVMPWSETLRVMGIMDDVRRQGGARFPQDEY